MTEKTIKEWMKANRCGTHCSRCGGKVRTKDAKACLCWKCTAGCSMEYNERQTAIAAASRLP